MGGSVCKRARALVAIAAAVVAATAASSAIAAPGLMVGITDDMFKLEPGRAAPFAADLGISGTEVSLSWQRGQTTVGPVDAANLHGAVATGLRVVLAVYGIPRDTPQDDADRNAYCTYVRNALEQVPGINDVVIWNEPNLSYFWRPQFNADGSDAAPAAYEALLARCWDVLHAYRPSVNVIAPATSPWGTDNPADPVVISHAPATFIQEMGDAYRASDRTAAIFDTVSQHVYGATAAERPWVRHLTSKRISEGDLGKLVDVLQTAFAGTPQAVPGLPVGGRTVLVWYLESGFETAPTPAELPNYVDAETKVAIPDFTGAPAWSVLPDDTSRAPDQATQLRDALRLAYCQPYVGAIFNFLLRDQPELDRWQSGVLWADGTPKGSYAAWRSTIAEARAGAVNCSLFGSVVSQSEAATTDDDPASLSTNPRPPSPPASVAASAGTASPAARGKLTIEWVRTVARRYWRHNRVWKAIVRATHTTRYFARIQTRAGGARIVSSGTLAENAATTIRFPRRRLKPGRYRVTVRAEDFVLRSAVFWVR